MNAILDAAEASIAERGFERATTNHIADAAGISVGSLYRWFPDKQAIAAHLAERYIERVMGIVDDVFDRHTDESTPLLIRIVLREIATGWLAQPALANLVAVSFGPVATNAPAARLRSLLIDRANALLALRVPGIPDRERQIVATLCIGLFEGALLEASSDPGSSGDLIDEAAYAIAAYLAMKYPFETSHRWLDPMEELPPSRPSVQ